MIWLVIFIIYVCFIFLARWLNLTLYRLSNYEDDFPFPDMWFTPVVNIIMSFIFSLMLISKIVSIIAKTYFPSIVKWFVGK